MPFVVAPGHHLSERGTLPVHPARRRIIDAQRVEDLRVCRRREPVRVYVSLAVPDPIEEGAFGPHVPVAVENDARIVSRGLPPLLVDPRLIHRCSVKKAKRTRRPDRREVRNREAGVYLVDQAVFDHLPLPPAVAVGRRHRHIDPPARPHHPPFKLSKDVLCCRLVDQYVVDSRTL